MSLLTQSGEVVSRSVEPTFAGLKWCPLCIYVHGQRTKLCVLHERINQLEAQVIELGRQLEREKPDMIVPLAEVEKRLILRALEQLSVYQAAKVLGIGKTSIYRKLRKYGEAK